MTLQQLCRNVHCPELQRALDDYLDAVMYGNRYTSETLQKMADALVARKKEHDRLKVV